MKFVNAVLKTNFNAHYNCTVKFLVVREGMREGGKRKIDKTIIIIIFYILSLIYFTASSS